MRPFWLFFFFKTPHLTIGNLLYAACNLFPNAVLLTETGKFFICILLQYRIVHRLASSPTHTKPLLPSLYEEAKSIVQEALPMSIPAGMFVMQQLLLIVAATYLDSTTFQIGELFSVVDMENKSRDGAFRVVF